MNKDKYQQLITAIDLNKEKANEIMAEIVSDTPPKTLADLRALNHRMTQNKRETKKMYRLLNSLIRK